MPHADWEGLHFDGIGTRWDISTPGRLTAARAAGGSLSWRRYDADWSRFRGTRSSVPPARQPGRFGMPAEAGALGRPVRNLYRLTNGATTPLIGGSLEQLGYGPDYSLRPRGMPVPAPRWEDILDWDGTVLTTTAPVVLDVGAAGKGATGRSPGSRTPVRRLWESSSSMPAATCSIPGRSR